MRPGPSLFVGRGRELERLRAHMTRAQGGAGSVAMLVGESGIGKTSLAHAFVAEMRAAGAQIACGGCQDGEWSLPLHPWSEALRELSRALGAPRIARAIGPGALTLGPIVPELRMSEDAAPLSPRDERLRLYDAVTQLLLMCGAADDAPLLLVLEDLHWADADSLALLLHVARFARRARWMILGTYRESEIDPNGRAPLADLLATLRRETDYERVPLRGFAMPEVAQFLAESAGRELPPAIVRLIFDVTVGNPFYVREVFAYLRDEGKIAPGDDAPKGDLTSRDLGIPSGVREVLGRRLARLSEETRGVLHIASATVGGIDLTLLDALSEVDGQDLAACIGEAEAAGMIHEGPGARHELTHAIVRRTIYDGLNPDRRARLHRRIAEALESLAERGVGPRRSPSEIAAQYHASAVLHGREAGIPHAIAAAHEAREASAYDRAVTFLRLARDLADQASPLDRAEVLRQLALAEAQAGLGGDARETAEAAIPEMEAVATPREDVAAFLASVARELKAGGAPAASWEPLVARGLATLGKKRDLVWARLKLMGDGAELLASGAVHVVRFRGPDPQAVRIARERGDEDDYAATLDYTYRTREETDETLRVARSWGRAAPTIRAFGTAARDLIYRHGDLAAARAPLEALRATSERVGSIPGQAEALVQIAHCCAAQGDVQNARESRTRAQAIVARLGETHRVQRIEMIALDASLGYVCGCDWRAVAEPAARIASDPAVGRLPIGHISAGIAVLGYALAGYARESRSLLGHLAPVFERCDRHVYHYGVALDCAATAVWHLGATELAARYRQLALGASPDAGGAPFVVRELGIARMAILLEDYDDARVQLARALARARAGGLRPLQAIVLHDEATARLRAGEAGRDEAHDLLERALAEFRALGMEPWIAHTGQLLGDRKANPHDLTAREVEILRMVACGRSNKEIAAKLLLSVTTVQRHCANIFGKIGARGRAEATAYAVKNRLADEAS
jgi:DNA-binding CsgD family transcriptional regulator